jgi:CRISPR-associated protein Csm1
LDKTNVQLVFGALLHDMGKVVYRGSSERKTHSCLGADFIVSEVAGNDDGFAGEDGQRIIEQIRFHHAKEMKATTKLDDGSLAWITYFADNISAGMDRKNEGDEAQTAKFDRTAKMRKIYNILNNHHDDNVIEHEDYNSIRERIKQGMAGIEVSARGVNSLLNLLEACADKVPSSTDINQLIDVSLFDHAKTTAAIAACIYAYLDEQGVSDYKDALFVEKNANEYYRKQMFLLFSCDMSGIQSFIYNISGEDALKQLRARSFYLEIMQEHIADELLERLGLSRCNLLYTGGGHVDLLLPNTKVVKSELDKFTVQLKDWFISNFKTDLYLACTSVECSSDDLANKGEDKGRYRNLYHRLSEKLSAIKATRYTAADIRAMNFVDTTGIDHSRECSECHRSDVAISDGRCDLCASLGELSASLASKDKDVFIVRELPFDDHGAANTFLRLPFGRLLYIYSAERYLAEQPAVLRIYTKNRWDTGINLATHIWMGDYTAHPEEKKRFSVYAKQGVSLKEGLGIERLGVLRVDVDNLGTVISSGLPDTKISISRSSTLSRSLSYFFKYHINEVLEKKEYRAQIIYSGGDDLFIIGNWLDIIYAAADIRGALDEYTGNGSLTISAGIGMFVEKYPIARMAAATGELEDAAKNYKEDPAQSLPSKNAVALWSEEVVFSWDDFINNILGEKLKFIWQAFNDNEKGRSFIYKLIELLRDREDAVSIPRLAYLLARSFEDKKDGTATSHTLFDWANEDRERKLLIAALEMYVYSIREREERR